MTRALHWIMSWPSAAYGWMRDTVEERCQRSLHALGLEELGCLPEPDALTDDQLDKLARVLGYEPTANGFVRRDNVIDLRERRQP